MDIPKPKKRRWYKKWWVWVLAVLLLLILGGAGIGYYGWTKIKGAMPQVLESYTVEKKDLAKTMSLEGTVQSKKEEELYFSLPAKVTEVNVQIGDVVEENKVLAKNKQQELKAPFDGLITEVNLAVDETSSLQLAAIKIESLETEIRVLASESEIVDLEKDLTAEITLDAYSDILLTGRISSVGERKEAVIAVGESQGYPVKLDYDKPDDLKIKRDISCQVEVAVGEKNDVLAIPLAAVKWEAKQPYVELETAAGSEKRDIELGFEGDEYIEVVSGLSEGEELILFSATGILN